MPTISRALSEARSALFPRHRRSIHFSFSTWGAAERESVAARIRAGRDLTDGPEIGALHQEAAAALDARSVASFASGRQAWYAILEALGVGPGDEVIVPGYTCVVVPAAVVYRGARPVYADIDPRNFGPDPASVSRLVTSRTKVVLAQHTYGIPCDVPGLQKAAAPVDAAIVEDCTHTFGARVEGRALASEGIAAFYSFEVTKPLTAGRGGLAVTRDPALGAALEAIYARTSAPPSTRVAEMGRQLLTYARLYEPERYARGKFQLAALHRAGRLEASIPAWERAGRRPPRYLERMSNLHAAVALMQVRRAQEINARRVSNAKALADAARTAGMTPLAPPDRAPLLRWPFLVRDRALAEKIFRSEQVELGVWFNAPLHPAGSDARAFGYIPGKAPHGERAARAVATLPTHPALSDDDLARLVDLLKRVAGMSVASLEEVA